ncbi:hypothetical protein TcCL_ESM11893 [Trypanosoma cruzi]|nr:hypothetical protein TcCL_ESM11893 [Trypanosoma cruzi]
MLLEDRAKKLEPHPAQAGDIFAAWRRRTLIPWNRLCSELILGPRLCSTSATGKSARPSFCAGLTCHITLYCCCCCRTPLPPGYWEMDRPLTPYELDVTICDSLLGSAPGHDKMLNEFLHHLGPVARGTLRTMIHNSSQMAACPAPGIRWTLFPFPNLGRAIPPRELQTYHATLCFTKINRRNDSSPSVSVIAAPPT